MNPTNTQSANTHGKEGNPAPGTAELLAEMAKQIAELTRKQQTTEERVAALEAQLASDRSKHQEETARLENDVAKLRSAVLPPVEEFAEECAEAASHRDIGLLSAQAAKLGVLPPEPTRAAAFARALCQCTTPIPKTSCRHRKAAERIDEPQRWIELSLAALHRLPHDPLVITALRNLTLEIPSAASAIVKAGGVQLLCKAMEKSPENTGVLENSVCVLHALYREAPEAATQLAQQIHDKVIALLLAALRQYPTNAALAEHAAGATWHLADTENRRELIERLDGVGLLSEAMWRFPDNVGVIVNCARALGRVVHDMELELGRQSYIPAQRRPSVDKVLKLAGKPFFSLKRRKHKGSKSKFLSR